MAGAIRAPGGLARALLACLALACLAGCASPRRPSLPPTQQPGAGAAAYPLRVGTSGDYPPFSVRASDGTLDGFDVAVARAWASDRGRKLELVTFRWPHLQRRLLAGDFDVAMSGVTVRGDRLALAPMSAAVARAAAVLVVPGSGERGIPADGGGMRVAVNRGGHLERIARERLPAATLVAVDDNRSLPALLASGSVDGVVTDTLEMESFVAPGGGQEGAPEVVAVLARDRKAYWVSPEAAGLVDDLDAWLAEREADGTLDALRARYLGSGSGPAPPGLDPRSARVVDLVARRLLLMPEVAAAKQRAGLPIEVPEREAVVVAAARDAAARDGLATEPWVALVREQIDAAKAVQRAWLASSRPSPAADEARVRAARHRLEDELRPAIDRIDRELRDQLVRAAPLRASADEIAAALREDAPLPGFGPDRARALATALTRLPAATRGDHPATSPRRARRFCLSAVRTAA